MKKIGIIVPYRGTKSDKSRLRNDLDDDKVNKILPKMLKVLLKRLNKIKEEKTIYLLTTEQDIDTNENVEIIRDEGISLNTSLKKILKKIKEDFIIIVMADLPLLSVEKMNTIIDLLKKYEAIIAPSEDKGTSILAYDKNVIDIEFKFGQRSSIKFKEQFIKKDINYKILEFKNDFRDLDDMEDIFKLKKIKRLPRWIEQIIRVENYERKN